MAIFARMRDQFRALIDTFARGWQKGDADELLSVFTDDAVFRETPFTPDDRGMAALRAYWVDLPRHQAEVTFKTGEIYEAGPWFATEFQLRFRRRRTGEWVDARGALFCETRDGKISEMRMYWHRQAGGRDEPAN
jgi:ketosteroid isomerase-like protein